jgi:hypothetical protein
VFSGKGEKKRREDGYLQEKYMRAVFGTKEKG